MRGCWGPLVAPACARATWTNRYAADMRRLRLPSTLPPSLPSFHCAGEEAEYAWDLLASPAVVAQLAAVRERLSGGGGKKAQQSKL